MSFPLRYATAGQEVPIGDFTDSVDGDTEENALTIANTDIKLWKTGATAFVNKNSGGATSMGSGYYYLVLDATDTGTYGPMLIVVHVAGALSVKLECCVYPALYYDAVYLGTEYLPVDALKQAWSVAGTTLTAKKPDTSTAYTKTLTTSASAEPVTGST